MGEFLTQIRERVQKGNPARIIFPENDARVLEAAAILKKEERVEPVTDIVIDESVAKELEQVLLKVRSRKVGTPDELKAEKAHELSRDPLMYGTYLLREKKVDALIAGAVRETRDVLRAALWLIGPAPGIKTISSSFYMIVPAFRGKGNEEVLTFADCGVVPNPSSEQLADIAIAAADARKFVAGDDPRVAFLSYSTKGSGGSGESIERVKKAIEVVRSKRSDIQVAQDELQVDAALIKNVAERKAPGDAVAGNANVLVFPDLNAANIAYKLVERLVPGAKAIGPVLHGLPRDMIVHDLSRGASVEDIVHSALIAAVRSRH